MESLLKNSQKLNKFKHNWSTDEKFILDKWWKNFTSLQLVL